MLSPERGLIIIEFSTSSDVHVTFINVSSLQSNVHKIVSFGPILRIGSNRSSIK